MPFSDQVAYLLDYTDWDRRQWEAWFRSQGPEPLAVDLGPNADGRIKNIGELVRHIFSAEQRYAERIQQLPLSETSTVPADDVDPLFAFGRQSRSTMRQLLRDLPADQWDVGQEIQLGVNKRRVTPRIMFVQAVTHEIRHWAQIATLLRLRGMKTGVHDFLVSGVFGAD